ncbi:MAG TPA: hypothetical protein EYP21_10530 [Syntrophaceae bacterium]|nr:hypothetical protein [Syntrophaceae bacterium]
MMALKVDMNAVKLKALAILSIFVFIFAIPVQAEIVTGSKIGTHPIFLDYQLLSYYTLRMPRIARIAGRLWECRFHSYQSHFDNM